MGIHTKEKNSKIKNKLLLVIRAVLIEDARAQKHCLRIGGPLGTYDRPSTQTNVMVLARVFC